MRQGSRTRNISFLGDGIIGNWEEPRTVVRRHYEGREPVVMLGTFSQCRDKLQR